MLDFGNRPTEDDLAVLLSDYVIRLVDLGHSDIDTLSYLLGVPDDMISKATTHLVSRGFVTPVEPWEITPSGQTYLRGLLVDLGGDWRF